jgi:ABC-type uncharacterized transport system permease subunit
MNIFQYRINEVIVSQGNASTTFDVCVYTFNTNFSVHWRAVSSKPFKKQNQKLLISFEYTHLPGKVMTILHVLYRVIFQCENQVLGVLITSCIIGLDTFWGSIENSAYGSKSRNMDELKTNISNIISDATPTALQAVSMSTLRHAQ